MSPSGLRRTAYQPSGNNGPQPVFFRRGFSYEDLQQLCTEHPYVRFLLALRVRDGVFANYMIGRTVDLRILPPPNHDQMRQLQPLLYAPTRTVQFVVLAMNDETTLRLHDGDRLADVIPIKSRTWLDSVTHVIKAVLTGVGAHQHAHLEVYPTDSRLSSWR